MGTRHLIAVQLDGQYRIAQYGQWDGYPSGQGDTVLKFLESWERPLFEDKLRAASFLTDEDVAALNKRIKEEKIDDWTRRWPELCRDAGAEILRLVEKSEFGIKLKNSIGFAAESLFCEYGYVIDLDTNKLEVFKGFQKDALPENDRFAKAVPDDTTYKAEGYFPIRMVASYPLDKLPTLKQMELDVEGPPDDEEEEAA